MGNFELHVNHKFITQFFYVSEIAFGGMSKNYVKGKTHIKTASFSTTSAGVRKGIS